MRRSLVLFATAFAALCGCAKSEPQLSQGGETNWLAVCASDNDCRQGSCLCGVCTEACEESADCGAGFAGSCVSTARATAAALCDGTGDPPARVCLPRCDDDATCGLGYACHEGVCTLDALDEEELADAYIEASIQATNRCCKQQGSSGVDPDFEEAVLRGLDEDFIPEPGAGARFDGRMAAACVALIAATECLTQKEALEPADTMHACALLYERGTRALGESCKTSYECAEAAGERTWCGTDFVGGELIQRCEEYIERDEGESCADALCRPPLICDESLRCVVPAERGEPCLTGPTRGDTCAVGSVCDIDESETCIAPIPVGEACDHAPDRCENGACFGGVCREPIFIAGLNCVWDEP